MEYFKGVVRNMGKKTQNKKTFHRYLVMGLIVTDKELPDYKKQKVKGKTQESFLIGGEGVLSNFLAWYPHLNPRQEFEGLSADQILTQLNEL